MRSKRIELILATGIFVFALIFISGNSTFLPDKDASFLWMAYSAVIYIAVVISHVWILPFFTRRKVEAGLILALLLFFATWVGLGLCVWRLGYNASIGKDFGRYLLHEASLGVAILVFLFLFAYEGLRRVIRYARARNEILFSHIVHESLFVGGGSLLVFLLLLIIRSDLSVFWVIAVLYAYPLYLLNTFWFIPFFEENRYTLAKELFLTLLLSFVLFIPFGVILLTGPGKVLYFVVWFCTTVIILPLSRLIYRRRKKRIAELVGLKSELGHTSADLKFLRSQINPHFLFNILNTLYGTALQEKAERTASGIQMLGDMMRFMLHENNQERILLVREMEYLRNYIALQSLRIVSSPEISVEYDIRDTKDEIYIAPMLLIPFVENAFKHGISLKGKSWIKITLYEEGGELYFDVHNSIHRKATDDPEHANSGIGLENVRQRLSLLYPDKHELVIRETPHEFFIHLTIQLRKL